MIPEVYAHRGYSARAPENTLAAFRLALEAGARAVELDVHRCASGELVVIHDSSLERTTGLAAKVEETPWRTIRELDAGSWKDARFAGERIPLLAELFEALGHSVHYDIEIKAAPRGIGPLEESVVGVVERYDMEKSCIISCFNPLSLRYVHRRAPELETAVLYSGSAPMPFYLRNGQGRMLASSRILVPHHRAVTPRLMERAARKGWQVLAWTVDDPAEVRRLASLGVHGIITNDPGLVFETLGQAQG